MFQCAHCGYHNIASARFCQSCGWALGALAVDTGAVQYAGFWRRAGAAILDWLIVAFGVAILSLPAGLVVAWLYEAFMLSSKQQATLGKMALRIVVTDLQGAPITFARATGRHFAKYLSVLTLGIGYLLAAFTPQKQALHDMLAGVYVMVVGNRR